MKFSELIEHCCACIKAFNPVIKTIDSHADEYIAQVKQPPTPHPRSCKLMKPNIYCLSATVHRPI